MANIAGTTIITILNLKISGGGEFQPPLCMKPWQHKPQDQVIGKDVETGLR